MCPFIDIHVGMLVRTILLVHLQALKSLVSRESELIVWNCGAGGVKRGPENEKKNRPYENKSSSFELSLVLFPVVLIVVMSLTGGTKMDFLRCISFRSVEYRNSKRKTLTKCLSKVFYEAVISLYILFINMVNV